MDRKTSGAEVIRSRRPKDTAAVEKLVRLMDNMGLSPEVLGAQIGVSGKRIRQITTKKIKGEANPLYGTVPERRVRYALARRFDLLPAHIWKADMAGMSSTEIQHMLELARREDRDRLAVAV